MPDARFPSLGTDARFPSLGLDARFPEPGVDMLFPTVGVDARFSGIGFGGMLPDAAAFGNANAHIYLDANSTFTGPEDGSDVTGVTAGGLLGLSLPTVVQGVPITRSAEGFRFNNSNYLRGFPSGTYKGCFVVADVTVHSQASGVGYIAFVDNDLTTRVHLRVATTAAIQGIGPGANTASVAYSPPFGTRQTVAFLVDPENVSGLGVQGMIASDGYFEVDTTPGAFADIVLNDFRVGFTGDMTLHRLAVFMIDAGGSLPDEAYNMWCTLKEVLPRALDETAAQVVITNGQSLALGPGITPGEENTCNYTFRDFRRSVKMLDGLQRAGDNVPVYLNGAMLTGYNTQPATGVVPAEVDQNLSSAYAFSKAIADNGITSPIWTGFVGAAGQSITQFLSGTILDNNLQWWATQAAARASALGITLTVPAIMFWQGHADKNAAAGFWLGQMDAVWARHLVAAQTINPAANPKAVIMQDNGDANTVADAWETCRDQVTWALANNALLIPIYPFEIGDDSGHLTPGGQTLACETAAWAYQRGAAAWNIPFPTASLSGNVLTLTYALPAGLSLVEDTSGKYAGEGVANLGYVVNGANINSVVVAGSTVTLTCDAPPTHFRYARQGQDLTVRTAPFPAHRGLVRTTLTTVKNGATLYHWLPSQPETAIV